MKHWHEVSCRKSCQICGKSGWCSVSDDGVWAICRRVDTGEGIHRVDKAGGDYWLYRLQGHRDGPRPVIERPVITGSERATDDILDHVYRALLTRLPLSAPHRENLRRRGLSDADIIRRQYRTFPREGRAMLARSLVDLFGADVCARVPGLYVKAKDGRRWWSVAGATGLLIAVRTLNGQIIALTVRSDESESSQRYSAVSSRKQGGPGPGAQLHVPVFEGPSLERVRVTEGPLKADVASALSGTLTVGLPGVSTWRQALSVLRVLQAQTVALAFDADAWRNWHVARALQQTASALMAAGFRVLLERWDERDGKGIDDLLAAGKMPEVLQGAEVREAIRAVVRAAWRSDPAREHQELVRLRRHYMRKLRLPAADSWLGPIAQVHGIPLDCHITRKEGRHGQS
jgi:Domain of unknown function (DUF3854)